MFGPHAYIMRVMFRIALRYLSDRPLYTNNLYTALFYKSLSAGYVLKLVCRFRQIITTSCVRRPKTTALQARLP